MTATTYSDYNATTPALDVAAAFPKSIEGRNILITGVNRNGIGFSTAEAFASQSPHCLILAGRTPSKIEECAKLLSSTHPKIQVKTLELDLSSQASVRTAASTLLSWQDVPHIDLLINNAGIMNLPTLRHTPEGIEKQFGTNHIGHFLFTNLIMPKIIAAAKANPTKGATRIINLSSRGVVYSPVRWSDIKFEKRNETLPESEQPNYTAISAMYNVPASQLESTSYHGMIAYGQSKTSNVLFSLGLTSRFFQKHGILSLAVHPGAILTELARESDPAVYKEVIEGAKKKGMVFKTLGQGASTTVVAAVDGKLGLPVKVGGWDGDVRGTPAGDGLGVKGEWEGKGVYLSDCQIGKEAPYWATSWREAERLWEVSEGLVGERFEY